MSMIRTEHLAKVFGDLAVLKDVNLEVEPGGGCRYHRTFRRRKIDVFAVVKRTGEDDQRENIYRG